MYAPIWRILSSTKRCTLIRVGNMRAATSRLSLRSALFALRRISAPRCQARTITSCVTQAFARWPLARGGNNATRCYVRADRLPHFSSALHSRKQAAFRGQCSLLNAVKPWLRRYLFKEEKKMPWSRRLFLGCTFALEHGNPHSNSWQFGIVAGVELRDHCSRDLIFIYNTYGHT